MNIIVLAGGYCPERDVSLSSGSLIANALKENGHDVMLLDLYLGKNSKEFIAEYSAKDKYIYEVREKEPDLDELKKLSRESDMLIGDGVIELCRKADVVFLALHGSIGENGQIQALFDLYGIKYTGTSYTGSLLAMNKGISKNIMKSNNILTPEWITITQDYKNLTNSIKLPCVIKPCSNGSSIGVSIVNNSEELLNALEKAFEYEKEIIIEEMIKGRELSVGVLDGQALPVIEIIPKEGFYDYKNKYQKGLSDEICPAKLNEKINKKIQSQALKIHNILHLGYYSRIDFILDENNEIFCLEANTLPGMTPTSLLPQEALSIGISYNSLCEKICNAALIKNN